MSPTRVLLHGAAGAVALLLTAAACGIVLHDVRGGLQGLGLQVVLASQLACWIAWPSIERCARTGKAGWLAGAQLAAVAYIGFAGEFTAIALTSSHAGSLLPSAAMALLLPVVFTGWLGFPAALFVTRWAVRSRSQELRHAAV